MRYPLFLLLAGVVSCTGRGVESAEAQTISIDSRVLGETRTVDVSLPRGYESEPGRRYPLLVVLDGEFQHEVAAALARHYASTGQAPPMIVAGVRNTKRSRDLTPAPRPGFQVPGEVSGAGGAERFLEFLGRELLPRLDTSYRTVPLRVLAGHSLGGLFALYALGQQPALFTGYIVMEPADWWNNQYELTAARRALALPAARRARVMMVNAPDLGVDTTRWGGEGPMVRNLAVTGETHASMPPAGMLAGLRTLFEDFRPSEWKPGTRPMAMLERYDSLAARVGHEVPIPASAFEAVIRMSIHSRFFEDAERALERLERLEGETGDTRTWRAMLREERAAPAPAGFIPLEIPARRPTPREAARFLGRWETEGHQLEIRAAGDTIVVRDRVRLGNSNDWYEGNDQVIQVTAEGVLEWGLPWFRGLAALLVLKGRVDETGTMVVTREARGWVPRDPNWNSSRRDLFRRVGD